MTAPYVARRLLASVLGEEAKRKVAHRMIHWTLNGFRRDPVTEYLHTDFWTRVGRRVSNG